MDPYRASARLRVLLRHLSCRSAGTVVSFGFAGFEPEVWRLSGRIVQPPRWLSAPVLVMVTSLWGAGGQVRCVPKAREGTCPPGGSGWGCWLQLLEWRRCSIRALCSSALGGEGAKSRQACSLPPCRFPCWTAPAHRAAQRQRRNPGRRAPWRSGGVLSGWSCPQLFLLRASPVVLTLFPGEALGVLCPLLVRLLKLVPGQSVRHRCWIQRDVTV